MSSKLLQKNREGVGPIARGVAYLVFILWSLITIFPLVWTFYSSFKSTHEILGSPMALPSSWQFTNYIKAWQQAELGPKFLNSVLYSTSSTFFVLLLAMMASYGFAKMYEFKKFSKVMYALIGIGLLISVQAIIIPLFLLLQKFNLTDSYVGIILTYIALGLPIAIYLGTEFIKGIPDSLIESAYIDGSSNSRMFLQIIIPMTTPVLFTISIMNILATWNEFMLVFILGTDKTESLPVGVQSFASQTSTQYGVQMAALVIALLPVVLVYLIFNKKVTQGVVAGAIKG